MTVYVWPEPAGWPAQPRAVVDTNVLLDCLVFEDPAAIPLWQMIRRGALAALRSADTDDELADVLRRPVFAARLVARGSTPAALSEQWQRLARPVVRVFPAPWHCTDPHDQKFLDLAATARADLLVTKDKALLRLARRARRGGLRILPVRQAVDYAANPEQPEGGG